MSGVNARYERGPRSYQVNSAVKGGQLVQARTDGKIEVATSGSAKVLGVALVDAVPVTDQSGSTTSYGAPVVDASVPQDYTSVAYGGATVPVTYQGVANFGDKLKVGTTAGQVAAWVSASDAAGLIVGICDEPKGVAAGAVGLMRTA